jgi:hypothetical protein
MRACAGPSERDEDLSAFQMRRYGFGDIPVGRGGQNDHDDLHLFDRLREVGSNYSQPPKSMRAAGRAFQLDAAALLDHIHMFWSPVV